MNNLKTFGKYKKYEIKAEMNPKVVSSSLTPATKIVKTLQSKDCRVFKY